MGKSYKKNPYITQEKENTKLLNRRIRYAKLYEFNTPGSFKRFFSNWGYKSLWTKEDAIASYLKHPERYEKSFPTLEDWLEYWRRCAYRK